MKHLAHWGYALFSGVLLSLAWPHIGGITPIVFIAFIPLLWAEHLAVTTKQSKSVVWKVFGMAYFSFLTWNLLTTWWIYFASAGGMLMANLANSLLMCIPFMAYHIAKRKIGLQHALIGFVFFWTAFEFLHFDWDLSWPWLTLGNAFASQPNWIQWYEYTGTLGGSIWVLTINAVLFYLLFTYTQSRRWMTRGVILLGITIILPPIWSIWVKNQHQPATQFANVLVIQPNVDPYAKFSNLSPKEQVERIVNMALTSMHDSIDYIVAPETALPRNIVESEFKEAPEYADLYQIIEAYPNTNLVIGASTIHVYSQSEIPSATARFSKRNEVWFDVYNTAMQLNQNGLAFYHKSKLVPGVEKMPFPSIFKHLEGLAIDLGGTTGSLGMQTYREAFFNADSSIGVAPVVCYESIYGEYVGDYLNAGASLIFIITNDGWWDNTPGHRQHLDYAVLRAIEHRKGIARSANTGISAFINSYGEISQPTQWWEQTTITQKVELSNKTTFYTQHGDYLGRVATLIAPLLLLSVLIKRKA